MSDLTETVALAIEDCHDKDARSPYEQIGHETALECARAAILAVLDGIAEPSEAMVCLGDEKIVQVLNAQSLLKALDEGTPALVCYRAMIATLRKEIANV